MKRVNPFWPLGLLLSLLLASCVATGVGVERVIDGDTIVIQGGERVRYIGIDAPELGEPWGEEAKEANSRLVAGKRVRLEKDITERDRYGRLLRYVYVDGLLVEAELVRLGLAQARAYPPDVKYQEKLEAWQREAKQEGRGIWQRGEKGSLLIFLKQALQELLILPLPILRFSGFPGPQGLGGRQG